MQTHGLQSLDHKTHCHKLRVYKVIRTELELFIWFKYFPALFGLRWLSFFVIFTALFSSVSQPNLRPSLLCSMESALVSKVVVINASTFFHVWQSPYDPYFLSFCQPLSSFHLEHALTHKLDP